MLEQVAEELSGKSRGTRTQKHVVVTDFNFPNLKHEEAAAKGEGARFSSHHCSSEEGVLEVARDANVLVVQFALITRRVIMSLPDHARIIRYGVGFDNVDISSAGERGVHVAYVPDYCVQEVADHTVTLLFSLLRKVKRLDEGIRSGAWNPVQLAAPIKPFTATTLGFIGLGRIATTVLERLKPFGFPCLAYDPYLSDKRARALGLSRRSLEELLAHADAILLHTPLTQDTRYIVNTDALRRMKKTAFLVNTARGGLIDETALAEALVAGQLAGAALDVFEEEPLSQGSPLRHAPNLLLSPHAAWYSTEAIDRLQRLVSEEITLALRGHAPRCPVPV